MSKIIGRVKELELLRSLLNSDKSEFIALYGRRRVGKTFLIREAYEDVITFQVTGLANSTSTHQLANFYLAMLKFDVSYSAQAPTNWLLAFHQLSLLLEKSKAPKKIVFIDELPWFDSPNSGFIQALEHFWNSWASARKDVLLIVCGSAASWMIKKLLNNHGGLHNRVTLRLKINPFTLYECQLFMQAKHANWGFYQIAELYMVLGGIPFYWEQVQVNKSPAQNVDRICFSEDGALRTEFSNLFSSLFSQSERHVKIVEALATKNKGLTRAEIIEESGLSNSGRMTELLSELEESGFIRKYPSFEKKIRNSLYQLVDFYTLFYIKFIRDTLVFDENNWSGAVDHPQHRAWSGYAFELLCLAHLPQIRKALQIAGIQTASSSWQSRRSDEGAQIDLVIDRRDQIINLCEMKFSINSFTIDKNYALELRNKMEVFRTETKTRKALFLTLITTFGLKHNSHSLGLVQNELTLEDLFIE
ncbi:MAG: ATP-binding protein [Bacteroidia bacterium]|nr:ATP-binding protein [Bacteroidia bacterium]